MTCHDTPENTEPPEKPGARRYHVVARRDGRGWRVHIDGIAGPAFIPARDLSDIEPRVRKYVWSYTGFDPSTIEVEIDVRLPPPLQLRLDLSEQLTFEASSEMDDAIDGFVNAQFASADVCEVLKDRWVGPRPLAVTNDEIARHGLSRCPEALGVRWDDHGRFLTITCRDCVEVHRLAYVDAPPDEVNILLYDGPLFCDCCHDVTGGDEDEDQDEDDGDQDEDDGDEDEDDGDEDKDDQSCPESPDNPDDPDD